jgi:hypothetical protein
VVTVAVDRVVEAVACRLALCAERFGVSGAVRAGVGAGSSIEATAFGWADDGSPSAWVRATAAPATTAVSVRNPTLTYATVRALLAVRITASNAARI